MLKSLLKEWVSRFDLSLVVLIEVHQQDWGGKGLLEGRSQVIVHTGKMSEVGVGKGFLLSLDLVTEGREGGINVLLPDLELLLNLIVSKLDFVLVDELTEEISKLLILVAEVFGLNFLWTKHVANFGKLIGDEVENWGPLVLVTGVSHDNFQESVLSSEVDGKLSHLISDWGVLTVSLEKNLETKSESSEVGSEVGGLI